MSLQALEGKDVKDLLLNVGSGGGAAAAPAAGGAAGGEAAAEETKEEEKEEGTIFSPVLDILDSYTDMFCSQGGVRRGYGFRSFRLNEQNISSRMTPGSRYFTTNGQGFWEELCALCKEFACHGKWVGLTAFYDKMSRMQVTLMQ